MATPTRPSVQLSDISEFTDFSRRQSDVSSMNNVPGLDLSMLSQSDKLVKQVKRSARDSLKSRRNIPRSSRIFNEIKTSPLDTDPADDLVAMPLTARSPSSDCHRKKRVALSSRLPPPASKSSLSRKPRRAKTHRVHGHNDLEHRQCAAAAMVQNHDVILSLLDCRKMEELRTAFMQKNHELDLADFVQVLWQYLNVTEGDEARVIHALTELFEDIDINDDQKMQWSEFSDFLAASQRHARDSEVDLEKYEVAEEKPFRFQGATDIQQLIYSKMYDLIALLMVNSLKVTVFDHRRNEIVNELRGHRNHIVSCAFLDGFDGIAFAGRGHRAKRVEDDGEGGPKHKDVRLIMATSGLDEVVIIWMVPYRKKPVRLRTISVNCVQITMYWSNKRKLFVTADMKHTLFIWNSTLRDIVWENRLHSDSIVDILLPLKTSIILSASLDKTVVAYDLSSDRVKFRVTVHKRGLIAMAYISSLHMLVTAAAEHKIRVCDGVVGCPLATLQGHSTPVISMIAIPESPAVVSLDSSNTFKLWDIRKMECIQSMCFGYPLHQISAMLSLDQSHKIALASGGTGGMHYLSRRHPAIQTADGSSTVSIDRASHDPVTGLFLLESKTQILSVHEDGVMKKWDLATGAQLKLIRLLPQILSKSHTISCCSVSDTKKLLLLGTSRGLVTIISIYSGGLVMKCQPKHVHNVVFVGIYKKMIVSVDSYGALQKYDGFKNSFYAAHRVSDDILLRSKLVQLPMPQNTKSLCTIGRVHRAYGVLILGTDTGLLRFCCLTNDKLVLEQNTLKDEVTSLVVKEEESRMFTADKTGNICCWSLPRHYQYSKMFSVHVLYRIQNVDVTHQPVSTFCIQTIADCVITGDAKGMVKVWQITTKEMAPGGSARQKQLFRLTEPEQMEAFECRLLTTFPVARDWLHHILVVTEKALGEGRRRYLHDDGDRPSGDKDDGGGDNVLCLVSASLDGQLFAWKMTGACLGELTASRRARPWRVRIDLEKFQKTRLKNATELFRKLEL